MPMPPRWVKLTDRANGAMGRLLAAALLAMALLTVTVVILRYCFSLGHVALQEAILWMHASIVALGAGYALRDNAHVRLDLFRQYLSPRARLCMDRAGVILLLLPLCLVTIWMSVPWVWQSWRQLESSSEAGGLPGLFLLKTAIPLGALLLGLQGMTMLVRRTRSKSNE